jgi:hypothetical protein
MHASKQAVIKENSDSMILLDVINSEGHKKGYKQIDPPRTAYSGLKQKTSLISYNECKTIIDACVS